MLLSIQWYPPAWVQIKTINHVIYIDPSYLKKYYLDHPPKVEFSTWPDEIDGLPNAHMETGDLVLITHQHKDHVKKVTLDRITDENTIILASEKVKDMIGDEVRTVSSVDNLEIHNVKIKVTSAYNTPEGSSTRKLHHPGDGVGYLLEIDDYKIYHAGDTDLIPEMDDLGPVDVAFLPIGGTYTMNIDEAVDATLKIKPSLVIPIHHLNADPQEFARKLRGKNIKIRILDIGEVLILRE
ncbi:MAG: hypothetical protein BME94_08230 [Methanobacteriales archaeon Met13]